MKYVIGFLLFVLLFYLLSFAGHNWKKKNKLAAIGVALLGITAFGLACFVLFFGNYEM
jgi:hypothetical protein